MNGLNFVILVLSLSSISFATTTLESVSGASRAVKTTGTDGTTTSWTIYGGIQIGRSLTNFPSCNTNSTCNTCDGLFVTASAPPISLACNKAGVFDNTNVTFTGRTTLTAGKWLLCDGTSEEFASADLNTSLVVPWSDLCSVDVSDSTCTGDLNKMLTFGAADSCTTLSSSSEKVTVKFYTRDVDISDTGSSTYDPTDCSLGSGACLFGLFPGDKKIYLEKNVLSIDVSTGTSSVPYTAVIFFGEEQTAGDASNDQATFERVGNNSTSSQFTVSTSSDDLEGSFISSLKNDVKYCFKMGSQDAAGNIDHISSSDCQAANCEALTPATCMTPSEVVGILSDKKCFIATAAYGSEMDQHVQTLRKFRNEFMAPFWIGRKLIKTYYKISPPFAKWIADKENVKSLVRGVLWPIMGWTELALKYGWSVVIAPFLVLGLGFLALRRRFDLRIKKA